MLNIWRLAVCDLLNMNWHPAAFVGPRACFATAKRTTMWRWSGGGWSCYNWQSPRWVVGGGGFGSQALDRDRSFAILGVKQLRSWEQGDRGRAVAAGLPSAVPTPAW